MYIIDTHCHIYDNELIKNLNIILENCNKNNIKKILLPNIDTTTILESLKISKRFPKILFPMLGLHPCYVSKNYINDLNYLETFLNKNIFCAIGEIGLDFFHDTTFKNEQIKAFEIQLEWAIKLNLPISIHSRNATQEVINIISNYKNLKGVFHCFSDNYEIAKQILNKGFYLGIGGTITFKNNKIIDFLNKIPLERLVLETDAPYLAPTPFRGKINEPSYLIFVVKKLSELYNISEEEIINFTMQNSLNVFNNI